MNFNKHNELRIQKGSLHKRPIAAINSASETTQMNSTQTKITLATMLLLLCNCGQAIVTRGMSIYPDALTDKPVNVIPDSEIGTWGRTGVSNHAFKGGMLEYYSKDRKALEYFTQCWIADTTNSLCFLGAGLFIGDVDSNYHDAVKLLEVGKRNRLYIRQLDLLKKNYAALAAFHTKTATCQDLSGQIDSISIMGNWEQRRLKLHSACIELRCSDSICTKILQHVSR